MRLISAVLVCTLLVALAVGGTASTATAGDSPAQRTAGDCSFPVTRTDATGTAVTLSERPDRIATLSPSAAQTLWEIGARARVVGVSEFAGYLDGTDDLPVVNTASGGIQSERLVALDPDLVIAPGTISNETVATLRDQGLTVYAMDTPATVEGVADATTRLGRLTGECTGAAETNAWMRANVAAVRDAVADDPRPTALYVFSDGWTVGADTFISDVFTTAGTRNVVAGTVSGYARVSPEVVRERNPEWIVYNSRDGIPDTAAYRETTAVRENQTVEVDVNYLNQPAPRSIVRATRTVATAVHPTAVDEASYVPRSAVEPANATATTTGTPTGRQTAGDGPGFGVVTAVVGVLFALLLVHGRRR
ncbi:iron complex transport system substrate-binding protein [Haloplanus vescus]|uniref:Iron complex transport system substrate-binding protein n=1 Tax=Haloplanus vescus TaxID=555874 RepID=A0A1H3WD39_9EURY|nr:PGF-CTERM-anchored ABC transporter substrate-binding protein [Haloplanus vescus]SDZ84252.1 iron complex transport system substrate-binding protein [Haloplanus vescus]